MQIQIIKNKTQYKEYISEMATLLKDDPIPDSPKGGRLALLAMVIIYYEKDHFPIEKPTAIEAIKFRMDQQGLKQKDLIPFIGSKSRVSEILSGKRGLTLAMVRNLTIGLKIPCLILLSINEEK